MPAVTPGTISIAMFSAAQRVELLAAPAEDERIAALQPHHGLAGLRARDQERIDLLLRHAMGALRLADGISSASRRA